MTGTGSTLPEPHLRWEAERLRAQLAPWLPAVTLEVLAECGSTNTILVERARALGDSMAPCLLVAEQQTAGRGRLGRGWLAAAGASLTFTLAVPLAPRDWSGLSLAVGLALAEALEPGPLDAGGALTPPRDAAANPTPRIALKWPNDLWLPQAAGGLGGKLGGILVESVALGTRRMCVVGVGINVQPLPETLAQGLGHAHAHLRLLDAQASAPGTLAHIVVPLAQALRAFERDGFAPLVERFTRHDLLRGREVTAGAGRGSVSGTAMGVDAQGALLMRVDGRPHRVVSGEVSVRWGGTLPRPCSAAVVESEGRA